MIQQANCFNMHRNALRIGGISLREKESNFYNIFSVLLLLFICAYPFLPLYDIFTQDFETVADLLKYEISLFVGIMKIITMRINRLKVAKLLNKLENKPFLNDVERGGEKEKELIKQCNQISTIQSGIYWGVTFGVYWLEILFTLGKRISSSDYHNWLFPFGKYTIFNVTRSPNYDISWAYQSFSVGWMAGHFIVVDTTVAAVLVHICFQLKILQINLQSLVKICSKKMLKENVGETQTSIEGLISDNAEITTIEWKYLKNPLKNAVKYHLAIINVADDLNACFSTLLLIIYLGELGTLSLMIYKVAQESIADTRTIGSLGEIIIATLQVVLVYFWSEQVIHESQEVGTAAFQSDFVGTDLRFQKALILIIKRSQSPIKLTGGKFVIMGMATLTMIVRSTYSAFMVLRRHNSNE